MSQIAKKQAQVAKRARLLKAAMDSARRIFDEMDLHLELTSKPRKPGTELDQLLDRIHTQPGEAYTVLDDALALLQAQTSAYVEVAPQ